MYIAHMVRLIASMLATIVKVLRSVIRANEMSLLESWA